jgi:predicted small lipoprotein YifL
MSAKPPRSTAGLVLALLASAALTACGEKPQTLDANAKRKPDTKASSGAQAAYMAPGWKAGDETDWQRQINQRAQGQNEYAKTGAAPK